MIPDDKVKIEKDDLGGYGDHWICVFFGHDFGPWHDCSHSGADPTIDHQLRGCRRCTTIQYFSPSGNV